MARTLKTKWIVLGSIGLLGVLLFAAFIAYVVTGDTQAKAKANSFCQSVVVGSSSAGVLDLAMKSGSASRSPQWNATGDGTDQMLVVFPAALPLTGYMCSISARDGVVTAAAITAVD